MLRVSIAAAFMLSTLPAFAMDGCMPMRTNVSKVSEEALREQAAETKATPVSDAMKAQSVRTAAAPKDEDTKVQ
jgi:hypothetical protein